MSNVYEMICQSFPPKPHWLPEENMPDLSGKVYVVTGGELPIAIPAFDQTKQIYRCNRHWVPDHPGERGSNSIMIEIS